MSKNLKTGNFVGMVSRADAVMMKEKSADGSYPVVITTSAPANVVDWGRWEIVREILLMEGCEIPGNKQVPLLESHSCYETEDVKGSVRNIRVEGDQLLGDVVFWSGATEEESKVAEGHLTDVSAGYKTYKEYSVVLGPGEKGVVNGKEYVNDYEDKKTLIIRTKWTLKETSLVAIGADTAAKFKSEHQGITSTDPELQSRINEAFNTIEKQKSEIEKLKNNISIKNERAGQMPETTKTPDEIRAEERARVAGIESIAGRLANNFKGDLEAAKKTAVNENWTTERFSMHLFENFDDSKPVEKAATDLGMSERDIAKFSPSRAIAAKLNVLEGKTDPWKDAGFEKEILDETDKKARSVEGYRGNGGLILPADYIARTTMTVANTANGGHLVGTQHVNDMVPLLRNKTIAGQLGVKIMSGLRQNIDIPKQIAAGTFTWGSENFAPNESNLTLGQITMSPKEGKATTSYGRKLFLQSGPSVDMIVNEDLLSIARIGLDSAVFHGAGGTAPTGLAATSGVGTFNGANLGWADILEAEADIATNNADINPLKWAINPAGRSLMKLRPRVAGYPSFLMSDDGKVNGYDALVSNQISAGYAMFGDWSRVIIGDWNLFEILVNPYKDDTGNVQVTVFVYADVAVQIASAFTIASDVS